VYIIVGIGMTMLALGPPSRHRKFAFCVFGVFSLVIFPLGLRGEVLFPLATALVVVARRRLPLTTGQVAVAALLLLVAITIVKDLRQIGVANAAPSALSGNPLGALAEMGSSLRPVVEVIRWHDEGEPYMWGATYWAPFDRAITAILPLWDRPPADQDPRIMNIVVSDRVGFIGFSVVAEAYRNFGPAGVACVMLLLGLLFGWMERWQFAPFRTALLGLLLVQLLFHIRNDFIGIPSQTALGVVLVAGGIFALRYRPRHALGDSPATRLPPARQPEATPAGTPSGACQTDPGLQAQGWGRRRGMTVEK
jgi:hypothetical protein